MADQKTANEDENFE
jgi:hypothetical protein